MRLLLFADPSLASSMTLLEGCLKAAGGRGDVEVVAVIDTSRTPAPPLRLARAALSRGLRSAFNLNTTAEPERTPLLRTCASLSRRARVRLLTPGKTGVNDPDFVAELDRLRADAAIALMVAQIFRAPLLETCGLPVNYHNGLLPRYQGVAATGWSIYEGAQRSGFSFHLMSEQVDRGPLLLQDSVPLRHDSTAAVVEQAKTALARTKLSELFDVLLAPALSPLVRDEPGSSFGRAEMGAIRTVEDPTALTLAELQLRLRAFEILDLTLAGERCRVTALRRVGARPRNRRLAFTTADGVAVEPSRILHLPPVVHRALRPLVGPA